jgi:hypothetical protein
MADRRHAPRLVIFDVFNTLVRPIAGRDAYVERNRFTCSFGAARDSGA